MPCTARATIAISRRLTPTSAPLPETAGWSGALSWSCAAGAPPLTAGCGCEFVSFVIRGLLRMLVELVESLRRCRGVRRFMFPPSQPAMDDREKDGNKE